MKEKFSIVIPTLQKNVNILTKLIDELDCDDAIGEIIIIDNSRKGFNYNSDKIKVVTPRKNLFVNPSWNLGVKLSKYTFIGILNDDILIPKNLCKQILDKLISDDIVGLIGMKSEELICLEENKFGLYPEDSKINFVRQNDDLYLNHWGTTIFGRKENFYKIPERIKIYCGDNFLIHKNEINKKMNYQITNCNIKHCGSLSCGSENFSKIKQKDVYYYSKIDKRFKKHSWYSKFQNFSERIFSVTNRNGHKQIMIFGLKFKFKSKKLLNKMKKEEKYNNLYWQTNNINEQIMNIKSESSAIKYQIRKLYLKQSNEDLTLQKKSGKKFILYVDWHILEPDTNAGDRASFSYLKSLLDNDYIIKYLPAVIDYGTKDTYIDTLKDLNVEIITDSEDNININYIKDWLRINGGLIDYVYLNRPDVYEKYDELLHKYINSKAKFIYQGHDIHYVRLQRMQEIDTNNPLIKQKDRYKKIEHKIWNDYDAILYFSKEEVDIVKSYYPKANVFNVPLFMYSNFEKIIYKPNERYD